MPQATIFMHVPFEGPAAIRDWLSQKGFVIHEVQTWTVANWHSLALPDWLVIMGGPMAAWDDTAYPWLAEEAAFIRRCIDAHKAVLGICLGAQLIARTLGARVWKNAHREIGWWPVTATHAGQTHPLGALFCTSPSVLHWHGDTFDIPAGAVHLAQSEACANQVFAYGDHVLALQCHLEMRRPHVERLAHFCADELATGGPYIQSADKVLDPAAPFAASEALLRQLLDRFQSGLKQP